MVSQLIGTKTWWRSGCHLRNYEGSSTFAESCKRGMDLLLCFRVDRTGSFVEHDNGWALQYSASNGNPLFLPARQSTIVPCTNTSLVSYEDVSPMFLGSLAHSSLTLWKAHDVVVNGCSLAGLVDLFVCCVKLGVTNVAHDRAFE